MAVLAYLALALDNEPARYLVSCDTIQKIILAIIGIALLIPDSHGCCQPDQLGGDVNRSTPAFCPSCTSKMKFLLDSKRWSSSLL